MCASFVGNIFILVEYSDWLDCLPTSQVSLFMHPDQAQNTSSGIQGQEATAVAIIYVTAPTPTTFALAAAQHNLDLVKSFKF